MYFFEKEKLVNCFGEECIHFGVRNHTFSNFKVVNLHSLNFSYFHKAAINLLLLFAIVLEVRGQEHTDSIICVYFHKMSDTVIVISSGFGSGDNKTYDLLKIHLGADRTLFQMLNSAFPIAQLPQITDSIERFPYISGINVSEKCLHRIENIPSGKKQKTHWGYFEIYTIKDIRLFENDTVYYDQKKEKYHFEKKHAKERALKAFYSPNTFVWQARDKRLTLFWFIKMSSYFDTEGNEVVTKSWKVELK